MNKLFSLPVILMACICMLTSCEKEKVTETIAANETKAANYVLVQHGYVDEYGNVGDLYVDENNPVNRYFEIYQRPQTRSHPNPDYTGTLHEIRVDGQFDHHECINDPTNCWTSGTTVSFYTGTTPIIVYLQGKE